MIAYCDVCDKLKARLYVRGSVRMWLCCRCAEDLGFLERLPW